MSLSEFEKAGLEAAKRDEKVRIAAAKREESRKKWQQRIGVIRRWVCSDKFWLHLAAVAALTVIISPWVEDSDLYKGSWSNSWWGHVFAGVNWKGDRLGPLDPGYVSHYWFVGFCLLMYAIRKNSKG